MQNKKKKKKKKKKKNPSPFKLPDFCYWESSDTSKFTEYLLLTDICQQQISRLLASDICLSLVPFKWKSFILSDNFLFLCFVLRYVP